jgi:type VI protein secretion system component VasK
LYSGDKIYREELLRIYFNAVEQRFREPAVRKLEDDLRKFASSPTTGNPEQQDIIQDTNFSLLTAYLMLSSDYKSRAESTAIINALKEHWTKESKLPSDQSEVAQEQLNFYARQVDREQFPPIRMDAKLVEDVRQKLKSYPPVNRYYKRKVTEISKQVEDQIGAMTAERILSSNGGDTNYIEATYTVPGAYTLEGNQLMKTAISEAGQKLSEDDWVMGEQDKKAIAQTTDAATLESRYYRDYADHWKNFVKASNVRPYDKQNADEALLVFSSANSPMEILLKEIARQTNLSAEPKPQGWIDWLVSFFRRRKPTVTGGNTQVEKEFRPLFDFVGEEGKPNAPVGRYRSAIGNVATKYGGFSPNEIEQISQDLAKDETKNFPQLKKAEGDIRSMLGIFNQTSSGQELSALLQEPLGNLQILLGADAKSQLAKTWTEKLLPLTKELEKGYPFESGETEADLKNLRTFLNPQSGELSKFYNERLKNYFETVDGQLKVKESSEVKFSDEFVAYLNNAFRLRRALYGESGSTEKFEYDFKLNPVKDAIIEVTIDGQPIKSEDTASAKLTFPASSGQTGVQMKFASTGGTTSTSGSTLPTNASTNSSANTSSSNVNSSRNFLQNNSSDSSSDAKTWQGSWGLFRFFDAGSPEKQASGDYLLKYQLGGKTVTATVKPSGEDLFDKKLFTSVRAPEKLLK